MDINQIPARTAEDYYKLLDIPKTKNWGLLLFI